MGGAWRFPEDGPSTDVKTGVEDIPTIPTIPTIKSSVVVTEPPPLPVQGMHCGLSYNTFTVYFA